MAEALAISKDDVKTNRHQYIGGSDIAAIMGMSRWKTPLKLWCEKTLKIPAPDLSNNEAVEMGTELEQFVADMFTKRTNKAVRRAPKMYFHPDYPYMAAHVDRLVTGTDELLECKTASIFKKEEWENEDIPQEYILQVMWYLGITGRKIGHIAVLIGGQQFKYKQIEFDQELFDQMVEAAKDFWEKVQNDIPPAIMANDDDTLKDLYGENNDIIIELYPTDENSKAAADALEDKIAYLQEIKGQIKDLQETQKEIETGIKEIIKDNLGIKTPKYVVTWKSQTKTDIDKTLLKEEQPEIAAKYTKVSSFRVMRVATNKEYEVA
jgi:putative phage-type endonuclease